MTISPAADHVVGLGGSERYCHESRIGDMRGQPFLVGTRAEAALPTYRRPQNGSWKTCPWCLAKHRRK